MIQFILDGYAQFLDDNKTNPANVWEYIGDAIVDTLYEARTQYTLENGYKQILIILRTLSLSSITKSEIFARVRDIFESRITYINNYWL